LIFVERFSAPVSSWVNDVQKINVAAREKGIPVFIVTNRLEEAISKLSQTPLANIAVMKCDHTAIRTAARTNPTIYLLQEGTVSGKWSHRQAAKSVSKINAVVVKPELNPEIAAPEPLDTPKIK
jgi:hypothetical protein